MLFASVQATMIAAAVRADAGPRGLQWAGVGLALAGLAVLASPGSTAPDAAGVLLMAGGGAAWGVYSLAGRRSAAPLATTATSFLATVPLALGLAAVAAATSGLACDATGLALAGASGAVTSGLGYAVWYAVLPSLDRTRAAAVQLAVPVLAAFAGLLLLGEAPSLRLLASSATILGGIALVTSTGRDGTDGTTSPD